jgi:HAD superfamily hydrolase (TIGR01509 family)
VRPIVFDCDGVLVDSEELSWRAWRTVAGRHGVAISDEDVARLTGRTVAECHAALADRGPLPTIEAFSEELAEVMHAQLEAHLQAFEDAVDALDALAGRVPMAVASSSYRDRLDLSLRATGLADHFDASVAGDEVAHGKPAPDLFVEAASRLGVDPADCLAVEDSPPGVASAVAAGMTVVAVERGPFTRQELLEAGATSVVPRLTPAALAR